MARAITDPLFGENGSPVRDYDASDWYWVVGGDETRLWSSSAGSWVTPDEPAFRAFFEAGGWATRIAGEVELAEVLDAYGLPGPVQHRREKTRVEAAIDALLEKGALTEAEIEEKRRAVVVGGRR